MASEGEGLDLQSDGTQNSLSQTVASLDDALSFDLASCIMCGPIREVYFPLAFVISLSIRLQAQS